MRLTSKEKVAILAKDAAVALVVGIEGEGKRDARIMRRLTGVVGKFIEQAYDNGWKDGHLEGIEVAVDQLAEKKELSCRRH